MEELTTNKHASDEQKDVYSLFDSFLKKTIIGKKSIFKENDTQDIFTQENMDSIIECYIKNPMFNNNEDIRRNFSEKLKIQFEGKDDSIKELFAHLIWLRYLPIFKITSKTKYEKIRTFLKSNIKDNLFSEIGLASYGMAQQQIDSEMVHLVCLFSYLQSKINDLTNIDDVKKLIIYWILNENDCKTNYFDDISKTWKERNIDITKHLPIHNMLLHLCNKDYYIPAAIQSQKINIVKYLYKEYVKEDLPDEFYKLNSIDCYIDKIRKNIPVFTSFWDDPIYSKWKGDYVADAYEILTQYQKQIILYGAPGTGKTYNAKEVVKEFILTNIDSNKKIDIDEELNECKFKFELKDTKDESEYVLSDKLKDKNIIWDIVQFNQSYSYEDFIEGIRPQVNVKTKIINRKTKAIDGGLKIVDGIFKKIAYVAKSNETKTFILIIDEINRGKIDKIFGELLYLLEYRDESLKLHYSGKDFYIPKNLYIIGTMNTADKSLALLDVALRRRFWFVRCEPQESVLRNIFNVYDNEITVNKEDKPKNIKKLSIKLFKLLNDVILKELGDDASELKIGHSYFLKLIKFDEDDNELESNFSDLKNIWFYSIIPLLEEYCSFNKTMLSELFTKKLGQDYNLSLPNNFTLDNLSKIKWK